MDFMAVAQEWGWVVGLLVVVIFSERRQIVALFTKRAERHAEHDDLALERLQKNGHYSDAYVAHLKREAERHCETCGRVSDSVTLQTEAFTALAAAAVEAIRESTGVIRSLSGEHETMERVLGELVLEVRETNARLARSESMHV